MGMTLSGIIKNTTYWSKQAGLRLQFFLAALVLWAVTKWLTSEYGQDDSNLWLVMRLFLQFVAWTLIGLCILSLITALVTWMYIRYLISKKQADVQVRFGDGQKNDSGWVKLSVRLLGNSVIRPLLGSIQARLIFSHKKISEKIVLDSNIPKPKNWWRLGIHGSGETLLHDRGIYDLEKVMFSVIDMLGLVALPVHVPYTQQLFTLPRPLPEQQAPAQPNATEEQVHRIDIPKRMEGELVNYKEFETGDNIQRIVWKIYAKSGELVVRIPETKDPYASHLYFYVSYFHGYKPDGGAFDIELLNVYKDQVRNLFEALQRNGYDVRLPHDQEVPKLAGLSEKKSELFQITATQWQDQTPPQEFVHAKNVAFVCLPSLVPAQQVEQLMQKLPARVPLVVVKLSEAITSPFQFSLKDVFFKPEKHPTDHLRQPWFISSIRRDLQHNEKKLEAVLKQRDNSWMTSVIGTKA